MANGFGLVDLGGGVKQAQFRAGGGGSQSGSLGQLRDLLTLQSLAADAKLRPLKKRKLESEVQLSENEASQIEQRNFLLDLEIKTKERDARREEFKFQMDTIKRGIEMMREVPEIGAQMIREVMPGVQFQQERQGLFKALVPGAGGKSKEFFIDLGKVTDPGEQTRIVLQSRKDFIQDSEVFEQQSQFFRNMLSQLNTRDPSGANDLVILDAFAKVRDPRGRVTADDVINTMRATGFSEQVVNKVVQSIESGGPIFGEKGSITRENIIRAARRMMTSNLRDIIAKGEAQVDIGFSRGFDGRQMVAPVGGLEVRDFIPNELLTPDEVAEKEERLTNYLLAVEDPLFERIIEFEDKQDANRAKRKNAPKRTRKGFMQEAQEYLFGNKRPEKPVPESVTIEDINKATSF